MSDFDAIDSLLDAVGPEAELPPCQVRRELRERARLSKAQVARALGVSPSTLSGWESGRDPAGEVRAKYAYLLDGLDAKLATETDTTAVPTQEQSMASGTAAAAVTAMSSPEPGQDEDDVELLTAPEPCVLCGRPAQQRVAGFAQHLDPSDCQATPADTPKPAPAAPSVQAQKPRTARPPRPADGKGAAPRGRAFQEPSGPADLIHEAVHAALAEHQGDVEAAGAALLKRAIPDAMRLLDETRKGARYDVIAHPWIPDILKKQTSKGADQIWEARPKWTRPELPPGKHEVTALDINGAYLSRTQDPSAARPAGTLHGLRARPAPRRSPPDHPARLGARRGAAQPDRPARRTRTPVGHRADPAPAAAPVRPEVPSVRAARDPRVVHLRAPPRTSWRSSAIALKDARDTAIADGDEVTLEYVKAMYSKFVSTMGESNYNRELYRPDWMHIIRSQAFANLWMKALKAHDGGLAVVRAMGTDELHVIGDWRRVFPEGRAVTEVKVKDTYTAGTGTDAGTGQEQ